MAHRSLLWLALAGLIALQGCSRPIDAYEGASLPDDQVATILGGGFPNLHSVDQLWVAPEPLTGRPDVRLPAGPHVLVIDVQPCSNANSCGLTRVTANLDLRPGGIYAIRQRRDDCTFWDAITAVTRREETPCRNYLWIEDRLAGVAVWGNAPVDREDRP